MLGRVDDLVAVSHECDFPSGVESKPRATHCEIHGAGLPSAEVDRWVEEMIETGRVDGQWDPHRRLREMEREGVSADVLIPDFGLPFELLASGLQEAKESRQRRTIEHVLVVARPRP